MNIGPNNDFDGMNGSLTNPGESVLEMLDNLLMDLPNVSPAEEKKALELLDQAYETINPEEAFELLQKALELDSSNVDIHLEFLDQSYLEDEYLIPVLQRLKKIAKKKLGDTHFIEGKGQFWSIPETRPYMRTCHALADECFLQDHFKEAIAEWEDMLRLNPEDHLEVKNPLLMSYLTEKMHDQIHALFDQYQLEDPSCCFSWGKVLHDCIQNDFKLAETSLKSAREKNNFLEEFIIGSRKLSGQFQVQHEPGSLEEAEIFAEIVIDTWDRFPEAIKWLKQQAKPDSTSA